MRLVSSIEHKVCRIIVISTRRQLVTYMNVCQMCVSVYYRNNGNGIKM